MYYGAQVDVYRLFDQILLPQVYQSWQTKNKKYHTDNKMQFTYKQSKTRITYQQKYNKLSEFYLYLWYAVSTTSMYQPYYPSWLVT